MVRLYADEQYPYPVVELLRALGYDVLTVQEAGKANQGVPDSEVLAFASNNNRVVITQHRKDFVQLHRLQLDHAGIIIFPTISPPRVVTGSGTISPPTPPMPIAPYAAPPNVNLSKKSEILFVL